jgi:flagellar motility protein MotE (MotC chaperone)
MTDDLVKRLREGDHFEKVMSAEQAADRIEELEAKLAKAVIGIKDVTREIDGVKEDLRQVADKEGDILSRAALRHIEELEAKLEKSEARSEVLETLIMDVAADLYDGVDAHKIDQRIMDVIKQLDEEEEDQ